MKIIVYGLGREFENLRELLYEVYDVVALCDKEKKPFDNYVSIDELDQIEYDAIFITSSKYRSKIEDSIAKRFYSRKILFLGKEDLLGKSKNPAARDSWVIEKLQSLPTGLVLLDAGAGEMKYSKYCNHLKYIAQDFGEYDPIESNVGLQMDKWDYPESIVRCDIVKMPFPDESIDVVLCTEVFEHIKDPLAALKEFNRVLKKNGRLILTAPFSCLVHMAPYFYNCGFSEYWYKENLKDYGFYIDEISSYGNYFNWLQQEIQRVPSVVEKYCDEKMLASDLKEINRMAFLLNKYDNKKNNSNELLCFGYRVVAHKCFSC